jgi:hypothetical protein
MVFFLCDGMLLLVRRSVALFCPDSDPYYVGWLINLIAWSSLFSWGVMDLSRHDVAGVFVLAWFFFFVSRIFFAPFSEVDARTLCIDFSFSVTDFWDFDVYCTGCSLFGSMCSCCCSFSAKGGCTEFGGVSLEERRGASFGLFFVVGVVFFFGVLQFWVLECWND